MIKNSLEIKSKDKNYQVIILSKIEELIEEINSFSNAILIVDEFIFKNYKYLFENLNKNLAVVSIKATEESKNLQSLEFILNTFQSNYVNKSTTIVGIGGGILQDIVFFASHVYYRGLDVYFIPTTLLAMCDSCIGSKCGLNFNGFKNQIGAFHSPAKVIIWLGFLESLPKEDFKSGYGEILKLILISGKESFKKLKFIFSNLYNITSELHQYILECLSIKKIFIEKDEFDVGIRRLLNYGHTFGHALELASNYTIPHGVAVARGMDIVNYIAVKKEFMGKMLYDEIHSIIIEYFYSDRVFGICPKVLIENTKKDKKNSNGMLNLVFLGELGNLFVKSIQLDSELNAIVSSYIEENFG